MALASNSNESTLRQLVQTVIGGYNSWSLDELLSYRAPNCIHQLLPTSLSRPPMTNAAYEAFFSKIIPQFRHFHVTLHDLIEDAAANKVAFWASSTAETDVGPYANEYMIVLHVNNEGKVERFMEFVDSAFSISYFQRLNGLTPEQDETAGKQEASWRGVARM